MTFERFYGIIRPHKAASFNTVKRARIIIVCIYIICFSYSIPFLFVAGSNGEFCIPNAAASNNILSQNILLDYRNSHLYFPLLFFINYE